MQDKHDTEARKTRELSEETSRAERTAHKLAEEQQKRNKELVATETAAALIVK